MKLLLALALMTAASVAHAETVTYTGMVNGKALSLTVSTQLPAAVNSSDVTSMYDQESGHEVAIPNTTPHSVYDPESGHDIEIPTTYSVNAGSVVASFNGATTAAKLFGTGTMTANGLQMVYGAIFNDSALGGMKLDTISLMNSVNAATQLSANAESVEAIQLPAQITVRYYGSFGAGAVQLSK